MARILIIEDDQQLRELLRAFLEREGYEVLDAADGEKGLEMQRAQPFDLVITDIFMPVKEGIPTIMEMRRDFPQLKIIAISGGGSIPAVDYLKLAGNVGAQRVFSKPFGRQELLDAVRELL